MTDEAIAAAVRHLETIYHEARLLSQLDLPLTRANAGHLVALSRQLLVELAPEREWEHAIACE